MYRGLLSRMLVMALLVAVIAKPCMGLMVGQANASGLAIAMSDDIAVTGDSISRCHGKSQSARIEDLVVVRPNGVVAGGDDRAVASTRADFARFELSHQIETDFSPRIVILDVRRRLTFLSRFLL